MALGLLTLVFGVAAIANSVAATLTVTVFLGVLFVFAGAVQAYAAFRGHAAEHRLASILWGIVMLAIGVSFLANPVEGALSLTVVLLAFLLASGVIRLIIAWKMRTTPYFWGMLATGTITVLLGGYLAANFGAASLALIGFLFGIELLMSGAGLIILAVALRKS
ncbi:acid-resistance membrane protein [Aquimixticola soesokkakensis]|uniref:Acid-resistance membrane protein n=2 Tax=Aquimixticola soesokkakensis TaxID=1519096 RepID=A0A1Y5RC82_9RHOB|nr:acid-resistance membrane protein [Aquimixticola soesokkakensis]